MLRYMASPLKDGDTVAISAIFFSLSFGFSVSCLLSVLLHIVPLLPSRFKRHLCGSLFPPVKLFQPVVNNDPSEPRPENNARVVCAFLLSSFAREHHHFLCAFRSLLRCESFGELSSWACSTKATEETCSERACKALRKAKQCLRSFTRWRLSGGSFLAV